MDGAAVARGRGARWRVTLALALVVALLVTALGPPAPVGATTRTVTNGNDSGAGSLRATIAAASAGDTIVFDPGVTTVTLTTQALTLSKNITIQGRGTGGVTVRRSAAGGTPEFRPFLIVNAAVVATLQGLTISGGRTPAGAAGGGVANFGATLTLLDCAVTGNATASSGGTGGEGGGVYQEGGALTLTNTTVSENSAGGAGGGLYLTGATTTASNILVSDNTTANFGNGGGIYQDGGTLTITGANVTGNNPSGDGGGLYLSGGEATLTDSSVSTNTTSNRSNGGGLYLASGTATLNGSSVLGNTATNGYGGGLYIIGGTATLTNSTISGNTAGGGGGGLRSLDPGSATLRFVTVTGNSADTSGGGLLGGNITLVASIVAGNTAGLSSSDCDDIPTSLGYNVVGSGGGCPTNGTGDLAYTDTLAALLDPLADNGGPTQTHALPVSSPAIDRVPVDQCGPANGKDQRGITRPQLAGAICDSGAVERAVAVLTMIPVGGSTQTFSIPAGVVASLSPVPGTGDSFVGWTVDGVARGWAPVLSITMDRDHTVVLRFAATKTFADTGSGRDDYAAIVALATRGSILGLNAQQYGPDQGVQRAQMAALIARATPAGPDAAPTVLIPPACVVAGTWDCDVWPNNFTDRNGLDGNLWRNIGALQRYGVTVGYTAADCAKQGQAFPCFGPTNPVTYAETITFITRAMVAKGYWVNQPNAPQPHAGVPAVFAPFVATFQFYTAGAGGVPAPPANWSAGATRGWFARALWAALDSYWGTDGQLPDNRPAGGFVP